MSSQLVIGLMSGTSLDGIDAVLTAIDGKHCRLLHTSYLPYSDELRSALLALHVSGADELERSALLGNLLAKSYAESVHCLLKQAGVEASQILAIGCHGQTIRHRPELGYTLQIGNPALLAELTAITVVADFRSRDIAAGGQGAPLVPAFHQAVFHYEKSHRVIVNIGGIANLTDLPVAGEVRGFDCGPGNLLMNAWAQRHLGKPHDEGGQWAASGRVITELLEDLLNHPFLQESPPKSTGRDTFHVAWLEEYVRPEYATVDVQRTLLEFTALTISMAISEHCRAADEVFLCGGGAHNLALVQRLGQLMQPTKIGLTDDLGISVDWVEAVAFAWLARQTMHGEPGNLPAVTGAAGLRVLGAIYPA